MKPLIVLIAVFILSATGIWMVKGKFDYYLAARIAMSVMLVFTGLAHFKFTKGMTLMMPPFMPAKKELVLVTGVIEVLAAVGLQLPSLVKITSWLLIVFFILLTPANIYAALHHIDYQKGTHEGPGSGYLWFRVPLQLFFIVWVYYAGIYTHAN